MSDPMQSAYDFSDLPAAPTGFNPGLLRALPSETYHAFAERNQLTYTPRTFYTPGQYGIDHFDPVIGKYHKAFTVWAFEGKRQDTPFTIARIQYPAVPNYEYVTFASIDLPQKMPNIRFFALLRHKAMQPFIRPITIGANQRVTTSDELFDAYFAVFTPKMYKEQIQQWLQNEDFRNTLLQYAPTFDIGIHSNKLYILSGNMFATRADFAQLFVAIEAMVTCVQNMQPHAFTISKNKGDNVFTHYHALLRIIVRSGLIALALGLLLGLGLVPIHTAAGKLSSGSIIGALAAVVALIGVFLAVGPDKQQPKRAKDTKDLVVRFGQVNLGAHTKPD